jgi:hypothetical protein
MSTVFSTISARARFRLDAIALTGVLAFAFAIPAPHASPPGAGAQAAHVSGTVTASQGPPPIVETGCCA